MHALDERGVPKAEQAMRAASKPAPDWESARVFLEVVRAGSFRKASEASGQSVNALRRRVEDLESALGVRLLTRHVDGIRTTVEGENVIAAVTQMEVASFGLLRASDQRTSLSGEVRLAVTEGLGTFWIAPRLVEFQRANPNLLVDVNCAMKSADVLRMEADIAIQITRPTAPDLRVVKLGRLHFVPFAAPSYLQTFGHPKTAQRSGSAPDPHSVGRQCSVAEAVRPPVPRNSGGRPRCPAHQCQQRALLVDRQGCRHRRAPHLRKGDRG